jgi:hypothetical protein
MTAASPSDYSVVLAQGKNETLYVPSVTAAFGSPLRRTRAVNILIDMRSLDGCRLVPLLNAMHLVESSRLYAEHVGKYTVLLPRGNCSFDQKVYNAQVSGAIAVIIHDNPPKDEPEANLTDDLSQPPQSLDPYTSLVRMTPSRYERQIFIPSVFVSYAHGLRLSRLIAAREAEQVVVPSKMLQLLDDSQRDGARQQHPILRDMITLVLFCFFLVCTAGKEHLCC